MVVWLGVTLSDAVWVTVVDFVVPSLWFISYDSLTKERFSISVVDRNKIKII